MARSKYGNRKVVVDGISFDSIAESKRYAELKLLMRAGEIGGLALKTKHPIKINGKLICTYVDDFSYWEGEKFVVEDKKGIKTPIYRLKKKLMKHVLGIDILET